MLRDKLIEGLELWGIGYDSTLENIFGEQAPVAQAAMNKSPEKNHVLDFLENFYAFLEEQSERVGRYYERTVDLVQLSYVIYNGFREEFPEAHITPDTTFKQLGVQPHEGERNLFVQVIVKNNGFEDGLSGDEYLRMLKQDIKYTILKFAEHNEFF